jgi:inositol phosphorylceramide mannosyltransferase catalytic subunit
MALAHFLHYNSRLLTVLAIFALANIYYFRSLLHDAFAIARMPFIWNHHASSFLISKANDNFDLSFANYSLTMDSSLPENPDLVPSVLHHIALGGRPMQEKWIDARQSCLDFHPGWEAMLWTDENAGEFVGEHFPELKTMWERYKFPIQRIDALRYMVLRHYGGMLYALCLFFPPIISALPAQYLPFRAFRQIKIGY